MKIIRYSIDGFKPQYQSKHLSDIDLELNESWFEHNFMNCCPEHLKHICLERHNRIVPFLKEHYNDFKYGIWAFIDGYKNSQSLNHLKRKVPCWKAEISDNTIVYDVNWEKQMLITDIECTYFGFYIPTNQLKTLTESYKQISA